MKVTPGKQHKNILGKFRCVLSTEQKEKVKTYLKNMDVAFYGLTIMDLRVLVYEYCTKNAYECCTNNCITHPLKRETR